MATSVCSQRDRESDEAQKETIYLESSTGKRGRMPGSRGGIRTGRPVAGKVETYPGRAERWVSTTKMPLRDERGQVIGTFGISRVVSV
jgi:hypothetical protein